MKKPKIVRVTWNDAFSKLGWRDRDDVSIAEIHTVGYLMRKTKTEIVVAQSVDPADTSFGCPIAIPQGCVTKVEVIHA